MNVPAPIDAPAQTAETSLAAHACQDFSRLNHVSDTAFWTAGIRALENERADALYSDPLAAMIGGEKSRLIARRLSRAKELEWGVSMRTVAIDRMVLAACAQGVDGVINLGAGLDTRPYRLPIPPGVIWIEADYASILEHKENCLADIAPSCPVECVVADLALSSSRQRVLARVAYGFRDVLVLTEGLVPYLSAQELMGLARDLREEPSITRWILDYDGGGADWAPAYRGEMTQVPRRFHMPHVLPFLKHSSWGPRVQMGAGEVASEFGRPFPTGFPRSLLWRVLPAHWKSYIANLSGVAELEKLAFSL